jgi:energy-coupling factor transport system ATP-binding protein
LQPLILADRITCRIDQKEILKDVSFSIGMGEYVALIGANGSGKTTLARHLNALLTPTEGNVLIAGKNTRDRHNHSSIRADIGMVFQQPEDQIVSALVEEDVAFGPENLCRLPSEIRTLVDQALAVVGMDAFKRRQTHLLSAGQLQRVALAGVLAMQPRAIIFDEATAMLDPAGRRDVMSYLAKLHNAGTTILTITHRMEEVLHAERVLVLNHGRLVFDGAPQVLFADPTLVAANNLELPVAVEFKNAFPGWFSGIACSSSLAERLLAAIPAYSGTLDTGDFSETNVYSGGANLIEIDKLAFSYSQDSYFAVPALYDVNFSMAANAPHGLAGATGAGKSTLLQHLNGLYRPQQGSVRVGEFDLNSADLDLKALRRYIGLVFQNPELYFFKQYVGDEIAFGPRMLCFGEELRHRVHWAMELTGLDFENDKDRVLTTLSGGEQRKVALAAGLALNPGILVLDEPTAGLDPFSRRQLLQNLKRLIADGTQLLFSSHQMEEISTLAKNLTVLSNGVTLTTAPVHDIFLDRPLMNQAGLEQPFSVQLADALRAKKWPVRRNALTLTDVLSELGNYKDEAAHA